MLWKTPVLKLKAAVFVTALGIGAVVATSDRTPPRVTSPLHLRAGDGLTKPASLQSFAANSASANLIVVVPRVPNKHDLRRLCIAFVKRGSDRYSSRFRDLVEVTGGTTAGTLAWCQKYLHRRH